MLDACLPGLDGFGVCAFIRKDELSREMVVVPLTGTQARVVRSHLGTLSDCVGGDLYLTKPYDGKLVAMMLWDALGRPEAGAAQPG